MSIIHQALERQRQRGGGGVSGSSTGGEPSSQPNRPVSPWLLALMVVVLIGGGLFWAHQLGWIVRSRSASGRPVSTRRTTSSGSVSSKPSPAATSTVVTVQTSNSPANATGGVAKAESENLRTASESSSAETGTVSVAAPFEVVASPASTSAPRIATTQAQRTSASPTGPTGEIASGTSTIAAIRWPAFRVLGVVRGRVPEGGSVILDRGIYDVGQSTPEGLKVMRVEGEAVWFEFQGAQRRVRVGTSTGP